MLVKAATEAEILAAALGPTAQCPSLEVLARLRDNESISPESARHLESCAYCRSELLLLQAFEAGATEDSDELREVTRRLHNMRLPAASRPTAATSRPVKIRRR